MLKKFAAVQPLTYPFHQVSMSKSGLCYITSPSVHLNREIDLKGNNYTLLSNTESERSRELSTSSSCNCLDLNAGEINEKSTFKHTSIRY